MNTLSFHRIKHLFASYFISNWQKDVKALSIVLAVNVFLSLLFGTDITFGLMLLVILSIFYAGRSFAVLGNNGAINYLSTPANTSEKLLTNITLTHFYYPIALYLATMMGILLGGFLRTSTGFGGNNILDTPFADSLSYNFIINTIIASSIFMFASVYFRKNAIAKTLFVFAILFFVFVFLVFAVGVPILKPFAESLIDFNANYFISIHDFKYFDIFLYVFDYVILIFFWVLSYFRLRETEA
jgi:hypothetical protein